MLAHLLLPLAISEFSAVVSDPPPGAAEEL